MPILTNAKYSSPLPIPIDALLIKKQLISLVFKSKAREIILFRKALFKLGDIGQTPVRDAIV